MEFGDLDAIGQDMARQGKKQLAGQLAGDTVFPTID